MTEKSRSTIHKEDHSQIEALSRALEAHCIQNNQRDEATDSKLDKLMPLVDLIPSLNEIVESQRAMSFIGKQFVKVLGIVSAFIGFIYLIFKFWKDTR